MKKIWTIAICLSSGFVFGQMTQATDAPSGSSATLYLCDSNTVNYANIIGSGVTWDYTNLLGIDVDSNGVTESRTLSVSNIDPLTVDSLFPGATKKFSINNQITTYYNTSSNERISQGFNFSEPTLGDIFVFWDTIPQLLNTYPFNLGTISSDTMAGRIFSENPTATIDTAANGRSFATIDGVGTLKLGAVDYANTFRYHFADTIDAYVKITAIGIDLPVTLYRDVYEYYNYPTSPLPIFVIYSINNSFTQTPSVIVLSKELPAENVGISEVLSENMIGVYPNPSKNIFHINVPQGSKVELVDKMGKHLFNVDGNVIDLTEYASGLYFMSVTYNGEKVSKKLIKN
jgi:hypothetical protein